MSSSLLFTVNETIRHLAISVFKPLGVSTASQSAPSEQGGLAPMQVSSPPSLDGIVPGAGMALSAFSQAGNADAGVAIPASDWNLLFDAIAWRLSRAVSNQPASALMAEAGDIVGRIQTTVLDCIADMRLLQAALDTERADAAPGHDGFAERL